MSQVYLSISVIVGIVLIVDAVVLIRVNGKLGGSPILSFTTLIEIFWAVASAIALYKIKFVGWSVYIPSLYLAHNVFGWVYGAILASQNKEAAENSNFFVPSWYIYFGGSVGLVVALASIFALVQ